MRFGYVLPNSWGIDRLDDVTALAVDAEALGADALWVSHHVLHVGFVKERLGKLPYHDPLVTLAVVAGATTCARLGVSVLVVPYLHPMPTAKTIATIDQLSGGRFVLGAGVGGLRVEHDPIGQVPFERRGRYADEFLDVVKLLWSGEPVSYAGEFFNFDGLEQYPTPVRPGGAPIMVGGGSDAALRRAAASTAGTGSGWSPDRSLGSALAWATSSSGLDGPSTASTSRFVSTSRSTTTTRTNGPTASTRMQTPASTKCSSRRRAPSSPSSEAGSRQSSPA